MSEDKKALELAIAQIERQYGKGSIMRLGNENVEPWPAISTGALSLDLALGIGGLPRGRIVEIYGPESSGKSTLALSVVAEVQRAGGQAVYVDIEHALDPSYMKAIGVNMDDLLLTQPSTGEDALNIVDLLAKSNEIDVIVVDSVAALIPKAELEGDIGQSHVGGQARLMSQAMRMLVGNAAKTDTLVIFINQLREKIGVMWGNPEVTSGGKALKFYASVRIDLRKKEDIKDDGEVLGLRVKAKVIKNKMAPAYRVTEFDILYGRGINTLGCIVDLAEEYGIIKKAGSWYSYDSVQLGQGRSKTIDYVAADLALADELKGKILELRR